MERREIRIPWFLIIMVALLAISFLLPSMNSTRRLSSAELEQVLSKPDQITEIDVQPAGSNDTAEVTIVHVNGTKMVTTVPDAAVFVSDLKDRKIDYVMEPVDNGGIWSWLPYVMMAVMALLLVMPLLSGRMGMGGMNAKMADFGKSRARLAEDNKIKFADVAGMTEEKEELEEIVQFLKDPAKFRSMGARIPKGVILVGPPGTGKTLLGKAVAGEAGVPFYSISGSDFVEMYVGVGAARVRDMFETAKKNAPCIVFIDEIDAVARRRGTGLGGSHDEREQTLNQMLVEMDGFSENQGIIVLAATNRVDILDPAIMRPGRFDRKVVVGKPDVKAREAILKLHAENKRLAEDVDLSHLAKVTAGFTGADLENLLNEAAITAASASRDSITQKDIEDAFIKSGIGKEKKSKVISERDRKITAYHETGHAILFHLLEDVGPVHLVSIIPTGEGAAGYTMPLPDKDDTFVTRGQLMHMMMAAMGGRIAEELVCDDITTGASQDIKQVTGIARAMVTQYGMSRKVGMLNYNENGDDVFLGYDIAHNKTYGDELLSTIDEEVKALVDECYASAKKILMENRAVLEKGAAALMEKEKLTGEEFAALFDR
ncbi:MAG: ATP-dependent zinc metalloprotease FtsH [Lachnospiraceae bacterium]|nr:ATP-dependent zinc metalloprotease FtsH [Lachnospiraceae bacterium]